MSDSLKYKGSMGTDNVELELPLKMSTEGTVKQQALINLFVDWLIMKIESNQG